MSSYSTPASRFIEYSAVIEQILGQLDLIRIKLINEIKSASFLRELNEIRKLFFNFELKVDEIAQNWLLNTALDSYQCLGAIKPVFSDLFTFQSVTFRSIDNEIRLSLASLVLCHVDQLFSDFRLNFKDCKQLKCLVDLMLYEQLISDLNYELLHEHAFNTFSNNMGIFKSEFKLLIQLQNHNSRMHATTVRQLRQKTDEIQRSKKAEISALDVIQNDLNVKVTRLKVKGQLMGRYLLKEKTCRIESFNKKCLRSELTDLTRMKQVYEEAVRDEYNVHQSMMLTLRNEIDLLKKAQINMESEYAALLEQKESEIEGLNAKFRHQRLKLLKLNTDFTEQLSVVEKYRQAKTEADQMRSAVAAIENWWLCKKVMLMRIQRNPKKHKILNMNTK